MLFCSYRLQGCGCLGYVFVVFGFVVCWFCSLGGCCVCLLLGFDLCSFVMLFCLRIVWLVLFVACDCFCLGGVIWWWWVSGSCFAGLVSGAFIVWILLLLD